MAVKPENSTTVLFDEKTQLEIHPELCTGCGLCQLSCTHIKLREFSLAGAYIQIDRVGTDESFVPRFTDECDSCGFCLNYCGFEAIRRPGEDRSWYLRTHPERKVGR